MTAPDEIEEAIRDLRIFLDFLERIDPTQLMTLLLLCKEDRSLSFSEIKAYFKNKLSSPGLSYHIRALEKAGIITNERRLNTSSGKARTSFYKITDKGKEIVSTFLKMKEEK